MYGPNQVGELILGTALTSQASAALLISAGLPGEVGVFTANGGLPITVANAPYKFYQKTSGVAPLNYEFSDIIDPIYTELVNGTLYSPEVQKLVTVSAVGYVPLPNTTYELTIYLYTDGGSLSPENFTQIQGYYVTGATAPTLATLLSGLASSLNFNLTKRGGGEFTVVATATTITIQSIYQQVVPGKIIGTPLAFDVKAPAWQNASDLTQPSQNLNPFTITVTTAANPGNGTGKYAVNLEWFLKGMKYEVYRQTGYPADFNTPYYADKNGTYNVIKIKYYKPRKETSVERQYKILTVMINESPGSDNSYDIYEAVKLATGTNGIVAPNPFTP